MIKVVIFDFGGVLGSESDAWKNNFKKILSVTSLTSETLDKIFSNHWPQLKIGKQRVLSFWADVASQSKNRITPEKLARLYDKEISINSNVLAVVKRLRKRGFGVALLTNEAKEWMETKIKRFKLDTTFNKIYCSAFMGVGKPAPEAFTHVLNDLGIKASEILFIDNQENNIEMAKNLGIKTILFKNQNQIRKELLGLLGNHS